MFATARDRHSIRVHGTSASGSKTRPVIRRTASTANIADTGEELNTVAFVDQHRVIDGGDISSDEDGGFGVGRIAKGKLGTQDDWESDSSDVAAGGRPRSNARHPKSKRQPRDEPFGRQCTPPMSTARRSSQSRSESYRDDAMQTDSPASSPIAAARQRQEQARKPSHKRKREEMMADSSDEDAGVSDRMQAFDDDDDNPFLAKPAASNAGRKAKPAAATKASYVL